jgi:glutamine synthetase
MAKLNEDWLGNSMDLKLIIKDAKYNNVLDSKFTCFKINLFSGFKYCENSNNASFKDSIGEHALSGIIKHLPDFLILYAPTVNSYKRLKEEQFEENWNKFGYMQDDCGVNIIEEKNIQKILFTLTGSDVNPYFALFGLLTSVSFFINGLL